METGIKHLHVLFVILFVLSVLIKTILLFTSEEKFENFRKKTALRERIITILFLVSGLALIGLKVGNGGAFHTLFYVKIGLILAAIPLAVIGFKKKSKIPAMLGAFLFILIYGVADMAGRRGAVIELEVPNDQIGTVMHGELIFKANCSSCHGMDGTKGSGGATNLTTSTMSISDMQTVISKGRKSMPSFSHLSAEETTTLADYITTLQKK